MKKGYLVDRIANYTSEPVTQIEQNTLAYIKKNKPDVICVYSEKSAINLKDLIGKYSLVDVMTQTNLMCLKWKENWMSYLSKIEITINNNLSVFYTLCIYIERSVINILFYHINL